MKKALAFSNGLLVGVMVLLNGLAAATLGNYLGLLLFYLVGLLVSTAVIIYRKEHRNIFKMIPAFLFISGVIGVMNIFLNNVCMNNIGVALTLALCLTGQIVFSAVFEHFGLFGVIKKKLTLKKIPGYLLIMAGAAIMIIMGVS